MFRNPFKSDVLCRLYQPGLFSRLLQSIHRRSQQRPKRLMMESLEGRVLLAGDVLYGSDVDSDSLFTIDTTSGNATLVGSSGLPGNDSISGLTFDNTGTLYGVDGVADKLVTFNTSTGAATVVGSIGFDLHDGGLAFDPISTTFYLSDSNTELLYTVNPTTGAATSVGSLGFDEVGGLEFETTTGTLYGTDDITNQFLTINTATGAATAVGSLGVDTHRSGLAFEPSTGTLYMVDSGTETLHTVNTSTGAATSVGPLIATGIAGAAFEATNSPPDVSVDNATVTLDEGQTATNGITSSDPDGDDVTLTASVGEVGRAALDFDGVNDRVELPPLVIGTSDFTVEAWFKTTDTRWQYILGRRNTSFGVALNGQGRHYGFLHTSGGDVLLDTVGDPLNDGQWHHLAGTFDRDGNYTPYIDGVALPTTNIASASGAITGALYIGDYHPVFEGEWDGEIDEIRIWNGLRTPAEILANMNIELSGSEPGLLSYYKLNDGTGSTTASDSTGNGNTGTLTNMDPNTDWTTPDWSFATDDGPSESQTVTITATDSNGASNTADFQLVVNNVAPTATFSNDGPVNEGGSANVSFASQFDPSTADTTAGFRYAYDYDNDGAFDSGDGTYAGSTTDGDSATVLASYLVGPGTHTVKGRIIDKDDGFTDYWTDITVNPLPIYDFSAATYSATEGDTTNTTNVVTVTRSNTTTIETSVDVVLAAGAANPATVGADFTAGPITITFPANETSQTVPIEILGETTVELDENIALSFANFTDNGQAGATQPTATLTLNNDDSATLTIADATVVEGDAGDNQQLVFNVTLDNPVDVNVSVDFETQNGTAGDGTGGSDTDYVGDSDTLTINAGDSSGQIIVNLTEDNKVELDETMQVLLSSLNASGRDVTLSGVVTNVDDGFVGNAAGLPPGWSVGLDNGTTSTAFVTDVDNGGTNVSILRIGNAAAIVNDNTFDPSDGDLTM
ncbi:MAG: Calx-beta domain-containing protein, partial [Pirellulaceae bacterium]|nr:Calx-beta domain-containing protein [Pirellulaceae bacterium]